MKEEAILVFLAKQNLNTKGEQNVTKRQYFTDWLAK